MRDPNTIIRVEESNKVIQPYGYTWLDILLNDQYIFTKYFYILWFFMN